MRWRSLTKHWRQSPALCVGLVLFELQPSPPVGRPPPPQRPPQQPCFPRCRHLPFAFAFARVTSNPTSPKHAAANPAGASRLPSLRPVRRVAELGLLAR